MQSEHWYVITYDIKHQRRLQKVHRFLRTEGYPLQESVFLWAGTLQDLTELCRQLKTRIRGTQDDLRILPIDAGTLIRFWGLSPFEEEVMNNDLPPYCNQQPGSGLYC